MVAFEATGCIKGLFTWKWGTPGGEVPHLPVVKKYLSSHVIPGIRGELQNAIAGLLSMHMNKELRMFVFFVCSGEAAFLFNVVVPGKTSV